MWLGIGRGGRGECVGVLTMGGDEGREPDFDAARRQPSRQALFSKCGGALLAPRRREARLGNQLGVAILMAASACSGRVPCQRIEAVKRRGRRRPRHWPARLGAGGARSCARRQCRAARRLGLGFVASLYRGARGVRRPAKGGGGLPRPVARCGPRWAPARACGGWSGLGRASGSAQSGR
jgi:hypothetical protein